MEVPEPVQSVLQGYLDGLNAAQPPDHDPPWTSGIPRHTCPQARYEGRSESITLHERYVTFGECLGPYTTMDLGSPEYVLDAYAIIFREGRCPRCGQTARSSIGRMVLTSERPPLEGRVAR